MGRRNGGRGPGLLIRGLGPIPAYGTAGAAVGTALAGGLITAYAKLTPTAIAHKMSEPPKT